MIQPIFEETSTEPKPETKPESKPESQPAQPKEPTGSIPYNLSRAPKSTALKNLLSKESEPAVQPAGVESVKQLATPFNDNDLIRCWDAYANTLVNKPHLKNTMNHCKPALLDNFKFEVKVNNPAQQEELIGNSLELLKKIRTQLKNEQIQMHIRLDEINEKKAIYTSTEKFEFLNNMNPLLSKLKDEFDLTID